MRTPAPTHHPRYIERPDDDLPNVPYPWQPPASGQTRRAMPQQLSHLEPNHGRN